jgi:hypothetical protein
MWEKYNGSGGGGVWEGIVSSTFVCVCMSLCIMWCVFV